MAATKKYIVLTSSSYPIEVTQEQYNEIKNSATTNVVETNMGGTIYFLQSKKYIIITSYSPSIEVTKERYDKIKNASSNTIESETDDTVYLEITD